MTKDELALAKPKTQIRVMRRWFFQNFQDPNDECPYDEGEFVYIYGGPYQAEDVLYAEFGQVISEKVIGRLVSKLEEDCTDWSGIAKPEDYDVDEYYLDTLVSTADPYSDLQARLDQLEQMLSIQLAPDLASTLTSMTFVSVITAMETYLSEVFINAVSKRPSVLRSFVETNPVFKKRPIPLSTLFEQSDKILQTAQEHLAKLLWHDLGRIKPLFRSALKVEFPDVLGVLGPAIQKRHDLVHRGGKTKDAKLVVVGPADVVEVIVVVRQLADSIKSSLDAGVSQDFPELF